MNDGIKVAAATEIVAAILTDLLSADEAKAFASDPQGMAMAQFNTDFSNISISVVENSESELHLTLPYYDILEELTVEEMNEESLDAVAGGEIIILAIGWITACIIGSTVVGGSGAAMAVGGVAASAIAAGVIVGGAAGGHAANKRRAAREKAGKGK